jgi:hypothetical protein
VSYELRPGDECMVASEYSIEGRQAFKHGDIVKILDISADPLQPGNKYVVASQMLGERVRLPGFILKRASCANCGKALGQNEAGDFADSCQCGWSEPEKSRTQRTQQNLEDSFRRSQQGLSTDRYNEYGGYDPQVEQQLIDDRRIDKAKNDLNLELMKQQAIRQKMSESQPVSASERVWAGRIKRDIVIDGRVAFLQGEQVRIEGESPDPERPQYRYVVLSAAINKRFRLCDNDVEA